MPQLRLDGLFILVWEGDDELHSMSLIEQAPPDGLICTAENGLDVSTTFGGDDVPRIMVDYALELEIHAHAGNENTEEPPSREEVMAFLLDNRKRFGLLTPEEDNFIVRHNNVAVYYANKDYDMLSDAWVGTYPEVNWENEDAFDVRDLPSPPDHYKPEGVEGDDALKIAFSIDLGDLTDEGHNPKTEIEKCARVEFDSNYSGGDYSGVGSFVHIPLRIIDQYEGDEGEQLKAAFNSFTNLNPVHIIHYSLDELYDLEGDLIED